VAPGTSLSVTAVAHDPDLPSNQLSFSLEAGAPTGAMIDPSTGELTWTPQAGDAGTINTITVLVADDGSPEASDTRSFVVSVDALTAISLGIADPGPPFRLLVTADAGLTYELEATDDLTAWGVLFEFIAPAGPFEIQDTNSSGFNVRLYRVKVKE